MVARYRTVLVGTDGSASSLRAVDRAAEIAHAAGAQLVLACAYRPMRGREAAAAQEALGELGYQVVGSHPAEDALREAAARARAAGADEVSQIAQDGEPVDVLIALADRYAADLVVVGNRGLGSLVGRLLGSVPAAVTRRARCDVLVVHTT